MNSWLRAWLNGATVTMLCFAGTVLATAPVARAATQPSAFLWEVTAPAGGDQPRRLWLFGTVHVGRADFYPLPVAVQQAFSKADVLVVEADITDEAAMRAAAPAMMYSPPESIETRLPLSLVQRLQKQLERLGLPYAAAKPMRPFILAGLLAVTEYGRQGFEPQQGVDAHLIRRASERKMPVVELEGVKQQLTLMASLPDEDQEAFLENSLVTLESGESAKQIGALVAAWKTGNVAMFDKAAEDSGKNQRRKAELEELLLYSRNRQMQAKAESFLAGDKTHFVAVGALHLTGPRGLVEGLRARGFTVTQR